MSFILGLDVGTASGAGATKRDGRVQPCALGDRTATMPAVVVLHEDGTALVGEDAERAAGLELPRVARGLRHDPVLQLTPITVGGEIRTPHEMLRTLYASMVQRISALHGASPTHLVLTHPAVPEGVRPEAVERVVDELFPGALVVPEPVAATVKLACDGVLPNDCLVAVYDFGGGTFDTSLVQRQGDRFSIVGDPAGLGDFGGIDVDDLVLDHVDRSLDGAIARLDLGDPAAITALTRLRAECRDAKERLSYDVEVTIDASLPNQPALVQLRRSDFEEILYPHLEVTVDVLVDMLDRAGLRATEVDAVALIGGSSRIPAVAELVAQRTGIQVLVDPYPELTVALGAAQMVDDEAHALSPPPFANLALPSLDRLGTLLPPPALAPDEVDARTAVGTALADRPDEDLTASRFDAPFDTLTQRSPKPSDDFYDDVHGDFDLGASSRFSDRLVERLTGRTGVLALSGVVGAAVVVVGALALAGGRGGNDDRTNTANGAPDIGEVSALGADTTDTTDATDTTPSSDSTSSSSSSTSSSSSSSSSSTTSDDDDGFGWILPRPPTTTRQGTSTSTTRPGTSTPPTTAPSTTEPPTTAPPTTEPPTTAPPTTAPPTTEPPTTEPPSSETTTPTNDDLSPSYRTADPRR
jgi:molecular chaperone DnaK